jgi:hypothetical protein
MKEREKILLGEEKNEPFAASKLFVSLDRADAFIEGGRTLIPKNVFGDPSLRVLQRVGSFSSSSDFYFLVGLF